MTTFPVVRCEMCYAEDAAASNTFDRILVFVYPLDRFSARYPPETLSRIGIDVCHACAVDLGLRSEGEEIDWDFSDEKTLISVTRDRLKNIFGLIKKKEPADE